MDYYNEKKSHKFVKVLSLILFIAFIFIESYPMIAHIRNSEVYLWISTIAFIIVTFLLMIIYKDWITSIMLIISNIIYSLRIIDSSRKLFIIFLFIYFILSIVVFSKASKRTDVARDGHVLIVVQGSLHLFILFFCGMNISLWHEQTFNLPIFYAASILAVALTVMLFLLIKRKNKGEYKSINLFKKLLLCLSMFGLSVLLLYQSVKVINYIFDFKEQITIRAVVVENDVDRAKNKRAAYHLKVKYEGKIYSISTDYKTAERYDVGEYIYVKINQGLFNIPYYHVDLQ